MIVVNEIRTERKGDIIKCEYTVSGGIEGGAYSLRVSANGDCAELVVSNVVNQATFDRERYYDVDSDVFDGIARIVDRYRMLRWSLRAASPVLVNDEEITTIRIVVSGNEPTAYKISSKQLLPINAMKAFNEIRKCIESYIPE